MGPQKREEEEEEKSAHDECLSFDKIRNEMCLCEGINNKMLIYILYSLFLPLRVGCDTDKNHHHPMHETKIYVDVIQHNAHTHTHTFRPSLHSLALFYPFSDD
jgi:hypothetical protein